MAKHRFTQLDVFTDQALCGNPLAVFPEAQDIGDEDMLKIAREMNLSETVFVLPPRDEKTLRRLRIFTPRASYRLLVIRLSAPGTYSRVKALYPFLSVAVAGPASIMK